LTTADMFYLEELKEKNTQYWEINIQTNLIEKSER
jgi:hypothetical protein